MGEARSILPRDSTSAAVPRSLSRSSMLRRLVDDAVDSPGLPLAPATRRRFEPKFGHDFRDVRIHSDERADRSATALDARAYTLGSDVVFRAGAYSPETAAGAKLLAHELAHVVQSARGEPSAGAALRPASMTVSDPGDATEAEADRMAERVVRDESVAGIAGASATSSAPTLARQVGGGASAPCDTHHQRDIIDPAFREANRWRIATVAWLNAYLDQIRRLIRDIPRSGEYARIGDTLAQRTALLERHFRISDAVRARHGFFPQSPDDRLSDHDLGILAEEVSFRIARPYREVDVLGLPYECVVECPRGRTGSDVLGSAEAGGRLVHFYTSCFDQQHALTQAGVALHEAFHACFTEFSNDTYSFEPSYPGTHALTNAESFAMFASNVTTGSSYRIVVLPAMQITGSPPTP